MKNRYIYFLHWNENKYFLSDLPEKNVFIEFLENDNIKGLYGSSPETKDLQSFQTAWKVKIDIAVRSWFNEKKFLIHLLLSAGIFLLSFYFFSYVIRDPLPVVDEFVLSSILAVLGWYRLSNQEVHSEKALLKKQELIQSMNRIPFERADFLKQIELYLEKLSSMKVKELEDMLQAGSTPLFFNSYSQDVTDFRKALDRFLRENRFSMKKLFNGGGFSQGTPVLPELRILYDQLTGYLKNKQ